MYFTPRGKDLRNQQSLDFKSYQKFLEILVTNKKIEDFFIENNIGKIAVVPNNHLAQCLVRTLKNSNIEIECIIDKSCSKNNCVKIYGTPLENYKTDRLKTVDSIIVTSNYYYNDIIDSLLDVGVPLENIIGLNTVLFALERLK